MPRCPLRAGGVVLLALLLAAVSTSVQAQDAPDREIADSQRRLQQIRGERDQLQEDMTRIRSRVTDLSSELNNIERQVGSSAGLLTELSLQLEQRELQIERNTRELLDARDRLAERRAILNRRLRDIYKRGPLPTLQVMLAAESFSDLLNRYRYLHVIARHDRRLADEVAELERQLVGRERALRASRVQLETVRQERSVEHDYLAELRAQQRTTLSYARSQETAAQRRLTELERDESRLGELVTTLERRRRESADRAFAPVGVAEPATASLNPSRRGTLDWPMDGRIAYTFGRTTLPNGSVVQRSGIGIEGSVGSPVRAVESGVVVHAGPFEGYGPTVIVSHGEGYYTVYLYLRDVRVREGAAVQRLQPIATVGGAIATSPYMEFQVRVPGGQPVDPLSWLRRR